jgi:hypothetical protein
MRCTFIFFLAVVTKMASAQAVPDAQTMLTEIRALRLDLRNTAVIMQRAQIAMYRLQAQAAFVEKATQRLDMARGQCKQLQEQQKFAAAQMERMKKQGPQNGVDPKQAEQMMFGLQAGMDAWAEQMQQCQAEQMEAESQFRMEQGKMVELEQQLARLDQVLAGNGGQ